MYPSSAATPSVGAIQRLHSKFSAGNLSNYWCLWSELTHALAETQPGQPLVQVLPRLARMHDALQGFEAMGAAVGMPHFLGLVAQAELEAGRLERTGSALAQARALSDRNGNALNDAELLRLQGELALATGRDAAALQQAATLLDAVIQTARFQGAHTLELRATVSRARLWVQQGQLRRAGALLQAVLTAADEASGGTDVQRARDLMRRLRQPP